MAQLQAAVAIKAVTKNFMAKIPMQKRSKWWLGLEACKRFLKEALQVSA
ncbi:hypothetical protein [Comamonas kerstersii]|nr:hypothetical protein [Comamonas kerstersii]